MFYCLLSCVVSPTNLANPCPGPEAGLRSASVSEAGTIPISDKKVDNSPEFSLDMSPSHNNNNRNSGNTVCQALTLN